MRVFVGWISFFAFLSVFASTASVLAQSRDDQAKALFVQGRDAFEKGSYETALHLFRKSYAMSRRGELQYNIALAADRLRRDEEALAAFEAYLKEVPDPSRKDEVRARAGVLRAEIAKHKQEQKGLSTANERQPMKRERAVPRKDDTSDRKRSTIGIVGPIALGVAGVAGATTMVVAIAKGGKCVTRVRDTCVETRNTQPAAYAVGAVGGAAIVGAVVWWVVAGNKAKPGTTVGIGPRGVQVSGQF